ncbi:hypothetical protein [Flavobacterium sp.]|uniref:hypothetical protein n=1 Tax=Flavobacterium sp. TaxID=239 RepID=UPI0026245066|nr:hypothetical protein [Flavobacterium sp.]MDG2432699.1 hypothetical protein [Flavobacterium sp.]
MSKYHCTLIFFFFYIISSSQTVQLTIEDEQGMPVPVCNVLFKEKNSQAIAEYTKIFDGNINYLLKKKYQDLELEITATSFYSKKIDIATPKIGQEYSFKIVLRKNETIQLQEVIIKKTDRPYIVKKDTVVFVVAKYRDGSEKKVEDLIKKLPGIEVDKNGSIKYKGKALETVTLDGDNVFSSNYKVGTKNINIDMVEQIEAIENYTKNHLLKGIESEGRVALNLKLKKGKSDYSGTVENGIGLKEDLKGAYYADVHLMQISAAVKSFTTVNLNNIGRSDTYFYEKQSSKSMDRKSEDDFRTKKILSDDLFYPSLDPIRFNRNQQFFASYNSLFKLSKIVSLKVNFNFIDDKINSKQQIQTTNYIDNKVFTTNDEYSYVKKPNIETGEIELRVNTSKASLIEIYSKQYFEKSSLDANYTQNKEFKFENFNETNSFFSVNKLVHTWKVANNKALQTNLYYSFDKEPQLFSSFGKNETIQQKSTFQKQTLLFNSVFLGKNDNINYMIQLGGNLTKTPYFSTNELEINNVYLSNNSYYNYSQLKYKLKKIVFTPSVSLTKYNFILSDGILNSDKTSNNFVFEPSLLIDYRIFKGMMQFSYSHKQKPISEDYIFTNGVFVNNRTVMLNNPSFNFQKGNYYSFNYHYTDLGSNTTLSLTTQYEKNNGQFLSSFTIGERFSVIKNEFFKEKNTSKGANLRMSRFFSSLSSTLTFSSNWLETLYPNFVNNSDIRRNSNQNFKNSFEFRSGFSTKVNFENATIYSVLKSKSTQENSIQTFQNTFKVRYKISKKSNIVLKSDLFVPDIKENRNAYNFVDFEYYFKWNDKLNFIVVGNNLMNLRNFSQYQNNDFSKYISQTNLTSRFILLSMEYSF